MAQTIGPVYLSPAVTPSHQGDISTLVGKPTMVGFPTMVGILTMVGFLTIVGIPTRSMVGIPTTCKI